jgi:acetylornithine deacetylase/succinyl-diaminopimelate desuccinylase-like protein
MSEDRTRSWIDSRADDMAALVARLVACNTENPPGRGRAECADILCEATDRLGLAPEVLQPPGIVRATAGTGERLVYFHGHLDVVPAQAPAQFTPVRRDGLIIGRGSADMKGGIVSMLYGAAAARELGLLGRGRIVVHLVGDEETGGHIGASYLREHDLIDPTALAMLTAEPSNGAIWLAAKGAITLRVEVHGREAHVGQAHLGVNSFLNMLKVAAPLDTYARELGARPTRFPIGDGEASGSMIVVGGRSGGGSNFNVVPGSTWFTVDGRYNPDEDIDAELARLTAIIDEAGDRAGAEVSIEVTQLTPPASTSPTDPTARLLARCAGPGARFELCPGSLDTRWYAELGIPAFGFGPGRLSVSHGPNEYVEEAALRRAATVYANYAAALLAT